MIIKSIFPTSILRKAVFIFSGLIVIWVLFAQCFIMRNRMSDSRATKIFKHQNVPLEIYDTVINNRHIHYAASGNSNLPTLVFIHGSPGSWMNYMKYMFDSSMKSKYRIISIDRPGFGFSDFGEAMHLQDQCELILPVLEKEKSSAPMILCGHSMGGPIVVKLAAMRPALFSKIILVAGSIDVNEEKKETWRKIMDVKPLYYLLPGAFGPSNTELLYLKEDLVPLQNEFSKITSDVQFIHGNRDTWVPISNVAYGFKMFVNAKSIVSDTIWGADHQIPWKNRKEFTKLLLQAY
jgi:pimeloyl-ACP methyl ester carboxylesterase